MSAPWHPDPLYIVLDKPPFLAGLGSNPRSPIAFECHAFSPLPLGVVPQCSLNSQDLDVSQGERLMLCL